MFLGPRQKASRPTNVSIIKFIAIFICGFVTCLLSFKINNTSQLHQVFTNYCPALKCGCSKAQTSDTHSTLFPNKLNISRLISSKHCDSFFTTWANKNNYIISKELIWYNKTQCKRVHLPECQPKQLIGPLAVDFKHIQMKVLKEREVPYVDQGGWLAPLDCKVKAHTAVIVPFRNRESHLPILLHQLLPIFQRRNQHFRVFVIEQSLNHTFNRGKLMNVGYREALRYFPYTCFVFHDVDLIPESDHIEFSCEQSPAHLSVAIDTFRYKLPYKSLFGGAEMLTREHFKLINGFSNSFWHWGGEDDNLYHRVKAHRLTLKRQSVQTARYKMIKHQKSKNIRGGKTKSRGRSPSWEYMKSSLAHIKADGLNNLQYEILSRTDELLYTHIRVNLRKHLDLEFGQRKYRRDEVDWYL